MVDVINVKDHGATGDGSTDDINALRMAFAAAAADSAIAEIYFPAGTYRVSAGIYWNVRSNLRITGAGKNLSIIVGTTSGISIFDIQAGAVSNVTISDLGFQPAAGISTMQALYATAAQSTDGLVIEDCRFVKSTIIIDGVANFAVRRNECHGLGKLLNTFLRISGGAYNFDVSDNDIRYVRDGILLDTPGGVSINADPTRFGKIRNNYIDLGFYTEVETYSGAASAIYTTDTLTDVTKNFTTTQIWDGAYVRAMVVRTANVSSAMSGTKLTDTGNDFGAMGVAIGDIVKVGTAWGIVKSRDGLNVLYVEQWLSETDRTPVAAPAVGAYTIYKPVLGQVTASAATQITVSRWVDLYGNVTTPANGTRYEVTVATPGSYPISLGLSAQQITVSGNFITRTRSDGIGANGSRCTITNNTVFMAWDMGIAVVTGNSNIVTNNTLWHVGVNSLIIEDSDHNTVSNNNIIDSGWNNHPVGGAPESVTDAGIRIQDSLFNVVGHNHVESFAVASHPKLAVLIAGTSTQNMVSTNSAVNVADFPTAYACRGAGATANYLYDNIGGNQVQDNGAAGNTIR